MTSKSKVIGGFILALIFVIAGLFIWRKISIDAAKQKQLQTEIDYQKRLDEIEKNSIKQDSIYRNFRSLMDRRSIKIDTLNNKITRLRLEIKNLKEGIPTRRSSSTKKLERDIYELLDKIKYYDSNHSNVPPNDSTERQLYFSI